MGILDSNFTKTQGKEKSGNLFSNLGGVFSYNTQKIDCRGFNSIMLMLTAPISNVDVQIVGCYPDGNITNYSTVYGIDVTKYYKSQESVKKVVTLVPAGVYKYLFDVSNFDYLGIGKITDNANTLSCSYQLSQNIVNVDSYAFNDFYKIYSGTGTLSENNNTFFLDSIKDNVNAILYKIEAISEFTYLSFFAKTKGETINLNDVSYDLTKKRYVGGAYDIYAVGTRYIVVPIEKSYESVHLTTATSGQNKAIFVKPINFDFTKAITVYNYWDKQTGTIGPNNTRGIPKNAKSASLTITGNSSSIGGVLRLNYIPKNSDVVANTSKITTFTKKIFDKLNNAIITNGQIPIGSGTNKFFFDIKEVGWVSISGLSLPITDVKAEFEFRESDHPIEIKEKIQDLEEYATPVRFTDTINIEEKGRYSNSDLINLFENEKIFVYKNINSRKLVATLRNIAIWSDASSIALSLNGFDGSQEVVQFNSTNFPGLISNSEIERVILLPWSRNATNSFGGYDWRINVITNKGQVYHNFPSRSTTSDGTAQANDYKLFDESCVWELPERWTPVKTKIGADADLISTGKYRYFPALPDEAYEMHPAINYDNGYGNAGFPAVLEKTKQDGSTVKFGRFYFTDRSRGYQGNPLGFMGGFEPHPKLSIIGTYKSNSESTGSTRICVFMTNDGGRNWFARYEFGATGSLIFSDDSYAAGADNAYMKRNLIAIGMQNHAGTGLFNVVKRSQYIPSASNKEVEKTKKFKYFPPIEIQSITANPTDIIVVTSIAHEINDGDFILFEKQSGAPSNEWDWIVNTGHTALSAGDGVLFKVKVIDTTTFRLTESVYNPHNNLSVRHIHSINRCKDGYTIGTGERYPQGWILYLSVIQSDAFMRLYPWDDLQIVRLNSTSTSIQRPLGVVIKQDGDNTVYIGVDNETTELGNVAMPAGRTDTFKRSSNGVWKGKLIDVDSQAAFECVFQSDEVCYFFKEVRGTMIYIGQQGHVGISNDGGKTWSECHLNTADVSRLGGMSYNGEIVIDNFIFKAK